MLAKKAIREIMTRKGIGLNTLARMVGKNSQFVSDKLNVAKGLNITADKLDELIRPMGYKIVLMPNDVKLRDGWYEVDDSRTVECTPAIEPEDGSQKE